MINNQTNTLADKTIIICSIVRNAEKGLKKNIPVIKQLCTLFSDYKIIIYENNSIDNTKKILTEWNKSDPKHVFTLLNDNDSTPSIPNSKQTSYNPFFSNMRIEKMARLRNKYMEYIEENNWVSDYLMVVDLDVSELFIDGIVSALEKNKEWDAITAFGYSISPTLRIRYHDTYALVEKNQYSIPQTEKIIVSLQKKYGYLTNKKEWIKVYSAFGGLAIYKFKAIKNLKYKVIPNNDPNVEVRCEHFSLYQQMHNNGFNNIYIVPEMKLKYQSISAKLIWKTLVRRIKNI